jgi:transcription elongation factor Elf1
MTDHGPQFDEFYRRPEHSHNGSEFDGDFHSDPGRQAGAHGERFDEFEQMARVDRYGERWDEDGWRTMPAKHGQQFDQDFGIHAALDAGEHGTWQDVFRGGTQVRYIYGGQDLEGVVLHCERTHVIVAPRHTHANGGQRHELGLGQIKELRHATNSGAPSRPQGPTAQPGNTPAPLTASDAHAPSAHDATASGRPLRALKSIAEDLGLANPTSDEQVAKAIDALALLEDEVAKARRGGGARGRAGSATPKSAPIHAAATGASHPEAARLMAVPHAKRDASWHNAARAHLTNVSAKFRAGEAAHREKTLPKVHSGGFTCTGCGHHSWRAHSVAAPGGGVHKEVGMKGCARCGTLHPYRIGKALDDVDVAKAGAKCGHCGLRTLSAIAKPDRHASSMGATHHCTTCGGMHGGGKLLASPQKTWWNPGKGATQGKVGKSVDSTETAAQGSTETVGHRSNCPKGGSAPCGADVAGKCSICGAGVQDHQALSKSTDETLIDLRKLAEAL